MTVVPIGKQLPNGLSLPSKSLILYRLLETFPSRGLSLRFSICLVSKMNIQIVIFFSVFSEDVKTLEHYSKKKIPMGALAYDLLG